MKNVKMVSWTEEQQIRVEYLPSNSKSASSKSVGIPGSKATVFSSGVGLVFVTVTQMLVAKVREGETIFVPLYNNPSDWVLAGVAKYTFDQLKELLDVT